MAELFGFKFERIKDSDNTDKFTQPSPDDGTTEISGGGHFATVLDTDGRERSEQDLIKRYRDISQQQNVMVQLKTSLMNDCLK